MGMKTLLSLFDYTGEWSQPFFDAGWNVIQWDMQHFNEMNVMLLTDVETCLDLFENVDGILAAIPCTHFAVSGAQYWKAKDQDGRTQEAIDLVHRVFQIVNLFRPTDPDYNDTFFWCIENPVGRLNKMFPELPKPVYFHPYEFAGYNNLSKHDIAWLDAIRAKQGIDLTNDEVAHIWKCNAYTKKTGLWGEFNANLVKKSIAPCKGAPQGSPLQRLGGKSDKTKNKRSETPFGFAQAFFEANHNHTIDIEMFPYSTTSAMHE